MQQRVGALTEVMTYSGNVSRKPFPGTPAFRDRTVPFDGWKARSDFLRTCIALGLNAQQIADLSRSTPQPFRHVRRVYEQLETQGLVKLFNSRRIASRRKGDHNQQIIRVFMKLYGQATEYGYEVSEVIRDASPHPRARFRTDLGLRIAPRLFFCEVQLSKIQQTRWHEKMRHYLRLYELLGEPFRALFLVDRAQDIPRLREYGRDVLRTRPNLNLYYFLTLGEFEVARDVIEGRVFHGCSQDHRARFSLMG